MNDLIGKSFGRYHILEQLGEGGMATVYKTYDTRLERDVAVKVIRTERLTIETMPRALKRFEREAKSLGKLTHPNIVPVSDYGEYEGKPYLVMPYLPGGTLKQKMGKAIPWQEAIQLLLPIAEALDYAHSQNMIHRDVKPANILLTQRGQPMLTDFGIAKVLDLEETLDLTGTSAAVGTPEYMAPEQATAKFVDHRVDIYSLGVVLYEMVTGRKPFIADTPMAVLIKHATEPLPRPSQFVSNIPMRVEKVLLKALAKQPENRYQSMREMTNALEKLQRERAGQSIDGTVTEEKKRVPKSVSENNRQARPNMIGIIFGLVVLVLLAIFGLFPLIGKQSPLPIIKTSPSLETLTFTMTPADTPTAVIPSTVTPTFSTAFNYTVQEGDYLELINQKYNLGDDAIAWILLLNPYKGTDPQGFPIGVDPATQNLVPGQVITLPAPGAPLPTATTISVNLPSGTKIDYIVQSGDTIGLIASKYNSTIEDILKANNITDLSAIRVGVLLIVPVNLVTHIPTRPPTSTPMTPVASNRRPTTYLMQSGEFPHCIARRFNVDPDQLNILSGLNNPDVYVLNQKLTIPQSGTFPGLRSLAAHPTTYTVLSSDETVYGIACKFGDVFPEDIADLNGIALDSKLSTGQKINIP